MAEVRTVSLAGRSTAQSRMRQHQQVPFLAADPLALAENVHHNQMQFEKSVYMRSRLLSKAIFI